MSEIPEALAEDVRARLLSCGSAVEKFSTIRANRWDAPWASSKSFLPITSSI